MIITSSPTSPLAEIFPYPSVHISASFGVVCSLWSTKSTRFVLLSPLCGNGITTISLPIRPKTLSMLQKGSPLNITRRCGPRSPDRGKRMVNDEMAKAWDFIIFCIQFSTPQGVIPLILCIPGTGRTNGLCSFFRSSSLLIFTPSSYVQYVYGFTGSRIKRQRKPRETKL